MVTDQLLLEEGMLLDAQAAQKADNVKKDKLGVWSETKTGMIYQKSLDKRFAEIVKTKLAEYDPGKGRSNARGLSMLAQSGLEPELISHLFVKAFLNVIPRQKGKRIKRSSLCIKVGDLIHDELRIRHFASVKERRNLLKKLFKQFDKRTYPREWRLRTIKNYFEAEQVSWQAWDDGQKQIAGYTLLLWFRDGTSLITAPTSSMYVDPTEEFVAHIDTMMEKRVLDYMIYKPMVVKPRPWSMENLFRGGYISKNVRSYPLVKRTGKRDVEEMLKHDWSQIIPAVNAMQETPFRVNPTVLNALSWAMKTRGGGIAKLPLADDIPEPPIPEGYRVDEKVTKAHNLKCFLIHSANREVKSKRLAVNNTIKLGEKFKPFEAIYFPHNLDSRGRAYPLPAYLNPQGPDYVKGLLEFAQGEPIMDEQQACWLAIAVANAYGNDKVSLQERADWTADNEDMIFSIANDPLMDIRWTEAAEPFQFLRACLEWRDFMNEGFGFMSHLVIPVDATCSGLQHYSAMLRDSQGGRAVNLTHSNRRHDIYQDVADRVNEKLMTTPEDNREIARNLLGIGIDRKITKRQVMVVPYAGTFQSCIDYTRKALQEERFGKGVPCPWGSLPDDATEEEKEAIREVERAHVILLARYVWDSIAEIVVKGREAMDWLTSTARAYVKVANKLDGTAKQRAITWVTPDGFTVTHYAVDVKKKRVTSFLDGRVDLVHYVTTDRLDSKEMAQAVAPNYVHSMDACLLRAAIMRGLGLARPITSFCMIHDSFGVHAARMPEFLASCVKPAFVAMYQRNVLADFRERLLLTPGLELNLPPDQGDLDLDEVLRSEFFFS
ncbi:DNA-directed RNA polymerase [Bradyrhizobium sp. SZCCHNRI2049]|uniref:DNA-directed RNA polymerase n=1 Tax=Bradyrhizobium sp. SZCCHNRI2049 TaxID=3057287 RepID=UPI0029165FA6|nr:DNA-directed RNA polymerase [Bradyrhizobium sp. SZCCHNRI2049]